MIKRSRKKIDFKRKKEKEELMIFKSQLYPLFDASEQIIQFDDVVIIFY